MIIWITEYDRAKGLIPIGTLPLCSRVEFEPNLDKPNHGESGKKSPFYLLFTVCFGLLSHFNGNLRPSTYWTKTQKDKPIKRSRQWYPCLYMLGKMNSSLFDLSYVCCVATTWKLGKNCFVFIPFEHFFIFFYQIQDETKKGTSVSQSMTKFMTNNLWEVLNLRNFAKKMLTLNLAYI